MKSHSLRAYGNNRLCITKATVVSRNTMWMNVEWSVAGIVPPPSTFYMCIYVLGGRTQNAKLKEEKKGASVHLTISHENETQFLNENRIPNNL